MERRGVIEDLNHLEAGRHRTRTLRSCLVVAAAIAVPAALVAGCSSSSTSTTTTTSTTISTKKAPMTTAAIRILQTDLVKVGCYSGQADGVNGPLTIAAVKAFQAASGISVDGVYGTQTRLKLIAAVNAGKKVCVASTTTTTGASSVTTTTASASGVPTAALTAITAYETAHGPGAGAWEISSTQRSSVDPSYMLFKVGPAPGHENTVQGGYGFVHLSGGTWSVTGFGSSEVGCPPNNADNQAVPTAVLSGFGLSCPTT
jgi:peptidoglycan hydrolase-like protein with peptidoglycan-binding domain